MYKKNINYRVLLKINYGTPGFSNTISIRSPFFNSIKDAKLHGVSYCDIHNTYYPIISKQYYINYIKDNIEYINKFSPKKNRKCNCIIS